MNGLVELHNAYRRHVQYEMDKVSMVAVVRRTFIPQLIEGMYKSSGIFARMLNQEKTWSMMRRSS